MARIRIKGDTSGHIDIAAPDVAGTQTLTLPTSGSLLSSEDVLDSDQIGTGAITAAKLDVGQIGGRRNIIINGAMQVAQRGTSGTSANSISYYTVDRFNFRGEPTGVYTIAQDTDAPVNFKNSTKITVTTPDNSIPNGERYWVSTYLEGNDIAHLNFGSSDAQQITLSFYVKSSLTGTFSGGFGNDGFNRAYVFEYTINSANTWERKTVTITGDTSGTWLDTNGVGLRIAWDLGAASNRQITAGSWQSDSSLAATGATQVIATNGATWQITGTQLEVGSVATPFEHRSYGDELQSCQRYYEIGVIFGQYKSSDDTGGWAHYKVTKRVNPSIQIYPPDFSQANFAYYYSTDPNDRGNRNINEINPSTWFAGQTDYTAGLFAGMFGFTPASENDATWVGNYQADAEL